MTRRRAILLAAVAVLVMVALGVGLATLVGTIAKHGKGAATLGTASSQSGPTAGASAGRSSGATDVKKTFGFGAFAITLGRATLRSGSLVIDATLENLAPDHVRFDPSHITVTSRGNTYSWNANESPPDVPAGARTATRLGFAVNGPFSFEDAVLVAGTGEQNQALVPLGNNVNAKLLQPRPQKLSGKVTAGTLTVEVTGGSVLSGDLTFNRQASKGMVIVHLVLRAMSTSRFGENFVDAKLALRLPDGTFGSLVGGSNEVLQQNGLKANLFADFEVPEPATGAHVLVVTEPDHTAELSLPLT
jgi:hypothetical protein